MNKEARAYCLIQRKIAAFEYAEKWGNVSRACRTFCISRAGFYRWKRIYEKHGEAGLKLRKPIAKDHPRRIPEVTVQKVLELRRTYHLGPQRIIWYMVGLIRLIQGSCRLRSLPAIPSLFVVEGVGACPMLNIATRLDQYPRSARSGVCGKRGQAEQH